MTEVAPADREKLLRSKQADANSIQLSRKRKLRELFIVAADENAFPRFDPVAPPTTAAEIKFLIECDLSQGRRFSDRNIPKYTTRFFDAIGKHLTVADPTSAGGLQAVASKYHPENGLAKPGPTDKAGLERSQDALPQTNGHFEPPTFQQSLPIDLGQSTDRGLDKDAQIDHYGPGRKRMPDSGRVATEHAREQLTKTSPGIAHVSTTPKNVSTSSRPVSSPSEEPGASPIGSRPDQASSVGEPAQRGEADGIRDQAKLEDGSNNGQIPQGDAARYPDALSSPGSTAQSTLTTVAHEGSADTSPDHEESHYSGKLDDEMEDASEGSRSGEPEDRDETETKLPPSTAGTTQTISQGVSGVEAQLLEESAAAQQLTQGIAQPVPSGQNVAVPAPTTGEDMASSLALPKGGVSREEAPAVIVTSEDGKTREPDPGATLQPPIGITATDMAQKQGNIPAPMELDVPEVTANPTSSTMSAELSPAFAIPSVRDVAVPAAGEKASPRPATPVTSTTTDASFSDSRSQPQPPASTAPATSPTAAVSESPREERSAEKRAEASQSLSAPQLKLLTKTRDRRRRSVPTVIFGKQPKKQKASDDNALVTSRDQQDHIPTDDYFTPLFIEGFTRNSPWMKPIEKLLNQAHKTVSTSDQFVSILDHQACKILRRVYHLQQHDKWSLRQPMRCPEPTRPPSHFDVLLQEMKWMRTDFREERKWKRTVARNLAYACAEWVSSSPAERKLMQVEAVIPPLPADSAANDVASDPVPDLTHSDSVMDDLPGEQEEEFPQVSIQTIAPSMLFALQDDEVVFGLQPSKTADELLANLPLYGSPLQVPKPDLVGQEYDPDAHWRRPALPLSKYVEGEMVLAAKPPPRKKARFQYEPDSSGDSGDEVIFGALPDDGLRLEPANSDVALFAPEMKATRDRIHAAHQFRPPSEFMMPPQSFYENRQASQWTWAEDTRLKSLVCEYSYNWSLISSLISSQSLNVSGAERRTPWECFERWVNLEGLPADFARSPYFKNYQSRIDAAQAVIAAQNDKAQALAQAQVGSNGAVVPAQKRRPTTTVRVERRRNQRHLSIIDAMRKLAKKRENLAQRAAQQANVAAVRKANEAPRQQGPSKTPRDYSLMRWERDQQLAERMAQYARRTEITKRAIQQQVQPHAGQIQGTPGAVPNPQMAAQAAAAAAAAAGSMNSAARVNIPGQLAVPAQPRPPARPPIQPPAGIASSVQAGQLPSGLVPQLPMGAIPQAQLQAAMQAQHRLPVATPQPDINLVMQAKRIQDQQRAAVQLQQQQQQQQQIHSWDK
ncbi:chromatin modification-related protein eaf-1 [Echria macrotheca]|uniref:Vacuolar import and degradation protein 21 n=1 Tax=Echria macrotheca TaxID=438768 RepID=A0AAJ0F6Z4_9PEZI|nr:chromatin modification-related protein eaf-1 [Echria macrotheca]